MNFSDIKRGAGRGCRNPDGNIAGPWCYVERQDSNLHKKELCDVPFCDDLSNVLNGYLLHFFDYNSEKFICRNDD